MRITLCSNAAEFNPLQDLADYQTELEQSGQRGKYGAMASFIGTMRDFNEGDNIASLFLDHYPGMTEKHLEQIVSAALQRWPLLDALVIHRVGELLPNQPIVLVAVWSAHRAAAFEACRCIMEELKAKAPFWKKERLVDGQTLAQTDRWVKKNTPA